MISLTNVMQQTVRVLRSCSNIKPISRKTLTLRSSTVNIIQRSIGDYLSNGEDDILPVSLHSRKFTSPHHNHINDATIKKPIHILMLHGLFGSHENFKILSKLVAEQSAEPVEIHCIDLRNHGNSPSTENHSYPLMALDLKHYIDEEKLERVILIGHSMGGKAAMYYSLSLDPQKVDALISIDIAPVSYLDVSSHNFRFDLLRRIVPPVDQITSKYQVESILATHLSDRAERAYLLKNLVEYEKSKFKWNINLEVLFRNQYKILDFPLMSCKPFRKPTLFIAGGESHRLSMEYKSSIRNLFPESKVLEIPETGHFVHAQKPSVVANAISKFLWTKVHGNRRSELATQ